MPGTPSSLDAEVARLRAAVLRALGATTLAAAGCGPVIPIEDAGGDRGSAPGDDGPGESSSATTTSTTSTTDPSLGGITFPPESTSTPDDGDDVKFDLPPQPDLSSSNCPDVWVDTRWEPSPEYECRLGAGESWFGCLPLPLTGDCADYEPACLLERWEESFCPERGVMIDLSCAADPGIVDQCCYMAAIDPPSYGCPTPGRPFTVDGIARTARLRPGTGWAEGPRPCVDGLDAPTRAALDALWRREALAEHAAVAAFARFTLELLALGAPADLVALAQQATAEELLHARRFTAFANAYGGVELEPGALDIAGGLPDAIDPVAVALAVAGEACIAETSAALQMCVARSRARDPAVAAVLAEIAEQEVRHALLGWRYLAWALAAGHPVRAVLTDAFARAAEFLAPPVELAPGVDEAALAAHGRLPPRELRAIASAAVRDVIAPAAAALLDATAQPLFVRVPAPGGGGLPSRRS